MDTQYDRQFDPAFVEAFKQAFPTLTDTHRQIDNGPSKPVVAGLEDLWEEIRYNTITLERIITMIRSDNVRELEAEAEQKVAQLAVWKMWRDGKAFTRATEAA